MSAVLLIARDGRLRRNILVNLKSAFAQLTKKMPFPERTLSLHYVSAVSPIAREGRWRRNTLVKLKSAFARLKTEIVKATSPMFKQEHFDIGRLVESDHMSGTFIILEYKSRTLRP